MRQTPTYKTFQARWGLGVYFQLRWKEIVLPLEEALAVTVVGNEKSSAYENVSSTQLKQIADLTPGTSRLKGWPSSLANARDPQSA